MPPSFAQTAREALASYYEAHGLDPAPVSAAFWNCKIGPLTLYLPNFVWRRQAILRHDLHHILTGYSCTMRGECQMAAWEFGAGRFPHPGATLFCMPLVAAGLVLSPRAIWSAFRRGRNHCSLYGMELTEPLLNSTLLGLRETINSRRAINPPTSDRMAFAWLILKSCVLVLVPIAGAVALATYVL